MQTGRFDKMHGLGNDFVVIDSCDAPITMTAARARAIADRRSGIGCDQIVLLEPSKAADFKMRIFNADGSEVEACGNAARCVVALIGHDIRIETLGGIISGSFNDTGVSINMGEPRFAWDAIPLAYAMDTAAMPVGWDGLNRPMAVNVGNPHVVFFVADVNDIDLAQLGPEIEHDPLFPQRVNVNVASVRDHGAVDLIVWERGAGLTRACGTGACATAVAAISRSLVTSPVTVRLPGGALSITWGSGAPITMTGPATFVFSGEADWSRFGE